MKTRAVGLGSLVFFAVVVACAAAGSGTERWTAEEVEELTSLWIGSLEELPGDPTNRVADDTAAASFGQRLFFDTKLSSTGTVSCTSCHARDREFQDDAPLATGVGTTNRRTMPIAATVYAPFLFWDGRKDSQWAQALGPLESPVEHGGTRAQYAHVIAEHYRREYESLFGPLPQLRQIPRSAGPVDDPDAAAAWQTLTDEQRDDVTRIYVNIGKAIAAYERLIQYAPSRFDRYVESLLKDGKASRDLLSAEEVAGLKLFIGKANCTQCHNGPLLTNNEFHNTGVPAVPELPVDNGRADGARRVLADEFNCRSRWSDAAPDSCAELEYLVADAHELERAYKAPSLRNVADRAPYMHAGQLHTLEDVVRHYNRAPRSPSGHTELKPLKLSEREQRQLEAYLRALSGGTISPALLPASTR